ncbi:MAG: spermidine/putrescine ABC transporter substrate-binding protein [Candidatus Omnitrophica bacterium]|nr:spermidine/putrescine ABC transporter substrate-binding protein [Candidatus Omnitrophota bacterium]
MKIILAGMIGIVLVANFALKDVFAQDEKLSKELNVFNWEDYFGKTTLSDFEKKYGVKINLETYKDEDEMLSAVQSNSGKYDIIVASGACIRELKEMRLLAELDLTNIPNLKNIERKYRNPNYDNKNKFSIPYLWGTTGLAYNSKYIKQEVTSWNLLLDPELKGKIAMLNNIDEVFAVGLASLGYSPNESSTEKLNQAGKLLLKQKELLAGYMDPITIRSKLVSGELWAANIYSGEAMFAKEQNSALKYIIPKEGAYIWVDTLAVPRDSKNKYTAEVFINYVLDPKVSAKIVNYLWYANCNIAASQYTLKEILENKSLYPAPEVLDKCEFIKVEGDAGELRDHQKIRNKFWSQIYKLE